MSSPRVVLRLTAEQQEQIQRSAGVCQDSVELEPLQLAMYALAAAAAGSDILPICNAPAKRWRLLYPEVGGDESARLFTITLALTSEQKEQIQNVTGRSMSRLRLAPEDFRVNYSESWDDLDMGPLRVGRSMVVLPAGARYESAPEERVIELPAGGTATAGEVFGTGRHAATRLSLELLERHVQAGDRVLDLGTGSGILAVGAARLGAAQVLALDVDPAAVAAARETISLNRLDEVVRVSEGSIEEAAPPYDVTVANIYSNVLMALAEQLAASVRPDGLLIASGVTTAMAYRVLDSLRSAGLRLEEQRSQEDWSAFAFRSPVVSHRPTTLRSSSSGSSFSPLKEQ